jgi:two-component system response regulator WspF
VVVQHVDSAFARGLVDWMAKETGRPVELAAPNSDPAPGHIYVARTEEHLIVGPDRRLRYSDSPRQSFFRPSVDAFFHSLARHWGTPGVAVLLTGMGRDGAEGLLALRQAGWLTIAQDRATSAVWGMPRAAVDLGAAAQVLPPPRIGDSLTVNCR